MTTSSTKILFTRLLTSGYKSTDVDNINKKIKLTKGGLILSFNLKVFIVYHLGIIMD